MVLPVSFDTDLSVGPQNSYHGPFKGSNGAIYVVLRGLVSGGPSSELTISLHKAVDPTSSFTEQDTEQPGLSGDVLESIWCYQVEDIINIVTQQDDGTNRNVYSISADMSDDTLSANVEIEGISTPDDGPNAVACSIGVATNGDIVVVYQGDPDMDMGTQYARIDSNRSTNSGANWDGPVSIDELGGDHWTGPVIVAGTGDRMHIFFKNYDNDDAFQRTLRSNDGLETFPSSFDTSIVTSASGNTYVFGKGISGSTITGLYQDSTGQLSVMEFISSDTPDLSGGPTVITTGVARPVNNGVAFSSAVASPDKYLLYSNTSQGDDIYFVLDSGSGFGSEVEILDAVDCNHVSPNIYDRSGTKLAYIYDNAGVVTYNEFDIGTSFNTLSGVKFSDQNYFHGPFDI